MKKIVLPLLIMLTMILTACGASGGTPTGSVPNGNSNNQSNNQFSNQPLPVQDQILIGTFKLENTNNAVTKTQAADLLPLWQVYKDLSSSDNAAQQEVDAVVTQIQDTMTPDQMKAITDMKLTRQDLFKTMQDLGISFRPANASGTPQPRGQGQGNFPPGGFQGGGGPGGGQGGGQSFGNGQNLTPGQIATAQARRAQGGGGFNRIPSGLMDALIKLLQTKASS